MALSRWLVISLPLHGLPLFALLLLVACAPAVLSPADADRSAQIEALGPEDPQVPRGPLHRPGQPCALCHDGQSSANEFVAAGTIFRDAMSATPLADAEVIMVDSAMTRFTAHTNCVGNFFVQPSEFEPVFPFWVVVRLGANDSSMESPVHRERSCASCHFDPLGPRTAGHVFLTADELVVPTIPTRACRPDEGRQ